MGSFGKDGDELRETELTLGLPGVVESDMMPQRSAKRPFSQAISDHTTWPNHHCITEEQANLAPPEKITGSKEKQVEMAMTPPPKAQVVGWPPIRSFRKNTLTAQSNSKEEALYVKVSMDGAPYLRKVDLKVYDSYRELSSALEKMFSCFTMGQCGSHQHGLNESNLMDLLNGSEYVPTYEDKDGDLMLVGDVPWEMFVDSCKRLRIMKGSEAIGLAPRSMEKCKT